MDPPFLLFHFWSAFHICFLVFFRGVFYICFCRGVFHICVFSFFQGCSTVSFLECILYLFSSEVYFTSVFSRGVFYICFFPVVYFTSVFAGVLNWEDGGSMDLGGMGLSRTDSRMSRVVMVRSISNMSAQQSRTDSRV